MLYSSDGASETRNIMLRKITHLLITAISYYNSYLINIKSPMTYNISHIIYFRIMIYSLESKFLFVKLSL